jgi:hypothetical protein
MALRYEKDHRVRSGDRTKLAPALRYGEIVGVDNCDQQRVGLRSVTLPAGLQLRGEALDDPINVAAVSLAARIQRAANASRNPALFQVSVDELLLLVILSEHNDLGGPITHSPSL